MRWWLLDIESGWILAGHGFPRSKHKKVRCRGDTTSWQHEKADPVFVWLDDISIDAVRVASEWAGGKSWKGPQ